MVQDQQREQREQQSLQPSCRERITVKSSRQGSMATLADIFSSIKEDLGARYRSPIAGTLVVALAITHWKISVYILTEKLSAASTIAFIEANTSWKSLGAALLAGLGYAILFPWFEHLVDRFSSHGKRKRNDFQMRERELEVGRKKLIAVELAKTLELEMRNNNRESVLADTELAKAYQGILSGENFSRWLSDLARGPINSSLNNTIVNYLHKVDSLEGKFIDPDIEEAHAEFVRQISTVLSALNDSRAAKDEDKKAELVKFSQLAQASQKRYRQLVREKLRI